MKLLANIDQGNKKSVQGYEDLLRKRLEKLGYRLSKRKTIQPGNFIALKRTRRPRGFRITDLTSGDIVGGEKYDMTVKEIEQFWLKVYMQWRREKQERADKKREERLAAKKRPKTAQINDRWTVTNDTRAIEFMQGYVEQHGDFDQDGHGAEGDIATIMYRAYRSYACPQFKRVWPLDGDWANLTDLNLVSDADEMDFPEDVVPITTQRRIWHNEKRIFIKLSGRNEVFFTDYIPLLYQILCNQKILKGWYVQEQTRKTKTQYRLHCRIQGKHIISFGAIVALFFARKIDPDDIAASLMTAKKWMQDNSLQIDHLKDNPKNNCNHNLCIVKNCVNSGKSDIVTEIVLPYTFLPVRIENVFRIMCGKAKYHADTDDYDMGTLKLISCQGVDEFFQFVKAFKKAVVANGDMVQKSEDRNLTSCVVKMFADDGQEYYNGQRNPVEYLLQADEETFTPIGETTIKEILDID